ncbi:MAG TPA: glycosyltransferase, partial [Gemmatimonadales bacterium]|nr:glycosyltransferase [Gemmatimonadales bacterium]
MTAPRLARPHERPRWTFAVLTLPSRTEYLRRLLASLDASVGTRPAEVSVLCNTTDGLPPAEIQARLRREAGGLPVTFAATPGKPSIADGRNRLLAQCRTPLVCYLDDDVTVHGDLLDTLEAALAAQPLALVGLRSYDNDTDVQHKPRESTPYHEDGALRYMPVHGLLCAGYTDTLRRAGGFNERRRFWGEWTELNLRLWRLGLPTGYAMEGAHLRHWTSAPDSPTRNRPGRERDVVWGLLCTALEYDAAAGAPGSDAFWHLIETRYLPYAFGADL